MTDSLARVYCDLESKIASLTPDLMELRRTQDDPFLRDRSRLLEGACRGLSPEQATRLQAEFDQWGPLNELLHRKEFTEIIINGAKNIWVEEKGRLHHWPDQFLSQGSYQRFLDRLCQEASLPLSLENPAVNGKWLDFRVHAVRNPLSKESTLVTLRRHPENPWTLNSLEENGWCTSRDSDFLRRLIRERKNILVIGPTGSGKTSVINSLLGLQSRQERAAVIEDTDEIALPPGPSVKLLTRAQISGGLRAVDQSELIRESLRMRPDRLVLGEIRGNEAKDFLMALSTGHAGSLGTLHAENPAQALIRLEMLIQMGAPQWSLSAIRQLIRLSLHFILVTGKNENGERLFQGAHRLVSLEETGFLLEKEEL